MSHNLPQTLLYVRKSRRKKLTLVFSYVWSFAIMYVAVQGVDEACVLMLFAVAPLVLIQDRPMKFNTFHYLIFAATIWILIAGFVNCGYAQTPIKYPTAIFPGGFTHLPIGSGLGYSITHASIWWLVIGYTSRGFTKKEIRAVAQVYIHVAAAICLLLLISNCDVTKWAALDRGNVPFLGLKMNANFYPYLFVPMTVICFVRMVLHFRFADLARFAAACACLILCRSKGGMMAFALGIGLSAVYLAFLLHRTKEGRIRLLSLGIALFVLLDLVMIVQILDPELLAFWLRTGTGLSTRDLLWKEGLGFLDSGRNVVFGRGWGYFYYMRQPNLVAFYGYHNFFVQYLCNSGAVAVGIFVAAMIAYILKVRDVFGMALLSGQLLHMLVENGFNPVGIMIFVLVYTISQSARRDGLSGADYFLEESDEGVNARYRTKESPVWVRILISR